MLWRAPELACPAGAPRSGGITGRAGEARLRPVSGRPSSERISLQSGAGGSLGTKQVSVSSGQPRGRAGSMQRELCTKRWKLLWVSLCLN